MYILQLDHRNMIFSIQFLGTAFIYLFLALIFLYFYICDITVLFQARELSKDATGDALSDNEHQEVLHIKRTASIPLFCLFVLILMNPLNVNLRNFRKGFMIALYNIMIAPFGNVTFKTYLLAEVLTDCSIVFMDLGRIAIYFADDNWNGYVYKVDGAEY